MSERTPGSRVGAYILHERLAVGGMSEVFLARSPDGGVVVVKLLGAHLAKDPIFHDLMRAEAAIGRRLSHPNVVTVLDQGEAHGEPFVVMEHVDGVDLFKLQKALQRTQRRMEASLGCYVVQCVLAGLSQIHAMSDLGGRALVHRDVSPSNVMLSVAGEVKLGDFGIAAPLRSGPARAAHGKVGYMATEQLLGGAIDHRVDLFSVGVVLSEVLTGRPLFSQGSDMGQLLALREAQVGQLGEVLADHPPGLVSVVQRALARSPSDRFQSAQELRAALDEYTGGAVECRQILAALVKWTRTNSPDRTDSRPMALPLSERRPLRRSSAEVPVMQPAAPAVDDPPTDPERTREVALMLYDLETPGGALRGRYTFARLIELALQGALGPSDLLRAEGQEPRALRDIPEFREFLLSSCETTSEVAYSAADWADAIPGCTFLFALARRVIARDSGMLVAEQGELRRELYFTRGVVTSVASSLASEAIGELLVGRKVITRDELNLTLAVLPRFGGVLDRALIELGLIGEPRLNALIADFALHQALNLFSWQSGTLRFFRGLNPPQSALLLGVDTHTLIAHGVQRVADPMGHFEHSAERFVRLGEPLLEVLGAAASNVSLWLLSHSDGRSHLRDLACRASSELGVSMVEVYREVYLLTETSALTLWS